MIYLEDLCQGQEFELGSIKVSKQSIIDFALQFDPQEFHLDETLGQKMFGGLIASGWHTASLCNRLTVDGFLGLVACRASSGPDQLKFLAPVFSGDTLSGTLTILATRISASKPDIGVAKLSIEMQRQDGTLVYTMLGSVLIARHPRDQ
jgi:acyl dehydratase